MYMYIQRIIICKLVYNIYNLLITTCIYIWYTYTITYNYTYCISHNMPYRSIYIIYILGWFNPTFLKLKFRVVWPFAGLDLLEGLLFSAQHCGIALQPCGVDILSVGIYWGICCAYNIYIIYKYHHISMFVSFYLYIYIHIYIRIAIYASMHVWSCMHVRMYVYVYVCIQPWKIHTHMCMI